MGPVSGIYWSAVTALYLFVSFLIGRWDRTWIVWACAGVLFSVVIGIARVVRPKK